MIPHHATALNLASVLEHQAMLTPDRVAVTFGSTRITYGELDAGTSQIAGGLLGLGIAPGDHVALSCPNVPWFPLAYFGILKAGAVVVPLNVLLKPREIAYHLKDSDAKALLAFEGTAELPLAAMARAACDEAACPHLLIMTADHAAPSPVAPALTLGQIMHGQPAAFDARRRRPDDTAVILYTSGTTGHPKGAQLTHENMLTNAVASRDMFLPAASAGFEQDVSLVTLPLFHSTAQTCQMNAGFYGGFRLVLLPRFDPGVVLQTIVREQVGFWIGVPTMYWALLEHVASGKAGGRSHRAALARSASRVARRCPSRSCAGSRPRSACGSSRATGCRRPRRSSASTSCRSPASPAPWGFRSSASTSAASTTRDGPWLSGNAGRSSCAARTS